MRGAMIWLEFVGTCALVVVTTVGACWLGVETLAAVQALKGTSGAPFAVAFAVPLAGVVTAMLWSWDCLYEELTGRSVRYGCNKISKSVFERIR